MDENEHVETMEIQETEAPPLEELVEDEGAPGNPETRAKIQVPEEGPAEEAQANPSTEKIQSNEWVEVAKGKKKRGRPKIGRPRKTPAEELSPEARAEVESAKAEKARLAVEEKIRANKASGIVTVTELGLLYMARRFGAKEEDIQFRVDEKKALQEAIAPLVSVESEDPWGNLAMVSVAVLAPRVACIASARQEQIEKEEMAEKKAAEIGGEDQWQEAV